MQKITTELLENIVNTIGKNNSKAKLYLFRELPDFIPDIESMIDFNANNNDLQATKFYFALDITCNALKTTGISLRPVSQSLWKQCLENNAYMYALADTNKEKNAVIVDKFVERYFQTDFLVLLFTMLEPQGLTSKKLVRYFRYVILTKSILDAIYLSTHNNKAEPGTIVFITDTEPSLRRKFKISKCMARLF